MPRHTVRRSHGGRKELGAIDAAPLGAGDVGVEHGLLVARFAVEPGVERRLRAAGPLRTCTARAGWTDAAATRASRATKVMGSCLIFIVEYVECDLGCKVLDQVASFRTGLRVCVFIVSKNTYLKANLRAPHYASWKWVTLRGSVAVNSPRTSPAAKQKPHGARPRPCGEGSDGRSAPNGQRYATI